MMTLEEAVKSGMKIPRYYLEGEPLPPDYFDEPPYDELPSCKYDWVAMLNWCHQIGRDPLDVSVEELHRFRKNKDHCQITS